MLNWVKNLFGIKKVEVPKLAEQEEPYAYAVVSPKFLHEMSREEREQEHIRLREASLTHLDEMGFLFDFEEAHARRERARELEEMNSVTQHVTDYFAGATIPMEEPTPTPQPATIINMEEYKQTISLLADRIPKGVQGVTTEDTISYYPEKPLPETQTDIRVERVSRRKKKKERAKTKSNSSRVAKRPYQPTIDVSPIHGIKKPVADSSSPIEDDYPNNPEATYRQYLEQAIANRPKPDIANRKVTTREYKQNIQAYDDIRQRLLSAIV